MILSLTFSAPNANVCCKLRSSEVRLNNKIFSVSFFFSLNYRNFIRIFHIQERSLSFEHSKKRLATKVNFLRLSDAFGFRRKQLQSSTVLCGTSDSRTQADLHSELFAL